jgi:pseudaminic acid cytidylyltransferase
MNKIPILIPIKGDSKRCPGKNRRLLPYTLRYLREQEELSNVVVISESKELLNYAETLGVRCFKEEWIEGQDELRSCYNFIEQTDFEAFYLLPVTQPFRSKTLIIDFYKYYHENKKMFDFITSYTEMVNREKFHIQIDGSLPYFKEKNINRKGVLCNNYTMIDGALYLIRTEFIRKVVLSENPNISFWNGQFGCVKNTAPFLDIDTKEDMSKFDFLEYYFKA